MTDPHVYQPAEDTFLLFAAAEKECRDADRILEVGCGSGYILSALGKSRAVECGGMLASDINPYALRAARESGLEVVRADLLFGIRGPFDLVLFNPPYLPTSPEERIDDWLESALDGGPDGRAVIARFIRDVGRVLAPGGRFLLLVSSLTGVREVMTLLEEAGYSPDIVLREMIEGEELLVIRARRSE
ncbi:MAG: methyltransferase [Methanoregulaceae archaeon]|nr:methyltransferase [Methanoregulaceae archaeon]